MIFETEDEHTSVVSVLVPVPIDSEVMELLKFFWLLVFLGLQYGNGDTGGGSLS